MPSQPQPIHVVTVDITPAKAWEFLARLIKVGLMTIRASVPVTNSSKTVEKDYNLVHIANCEGEPHFSLARHELTLNLSAIKDVKPVLSSLIIAPQVLVDPPFPHSSPRK
jgi:hypothetical protein